MSSYSAILIENDMMVLLMKVIMLVMGMVMRMVNDAYKDGDVGDDDEIDYEAGDDDDENEGGENYENTLMRRW